MATAVANRVKETTTTSGTGAVTLLGAAVGYQTFSAAIGNGNACYYCIADQAGTNWEIGVGTYTSSGNTLSRTTVLASSNSNSLVNFGSNTKDVFVTIPAGSAVLQDSATGAAKMPAGTTAQRPATGEAGMYRLNSTTGYPEYWNATKSLWLPMASTVYQIDALVVAGGGGGGTAQRGGGGGAGGMIAATSITVADGSAYTVTIGSGGAANASGSNTTFGSLYTAVAGGKGGTYTGGGPASGGSGGGGGANQSGASGTAGQGNSGGAGLTGTYDSGGGGGGAGGGGGSGNGNSGGGGGSGAANSFSGSSVNYAGGGGGATGSGPAGYRGLGGAGGGGDGGYAGVAGVNGTANTGGGGGGAPDGAASGAGGSGIVIIRYAGSQRASGGTVTSVGGYTIHTFTSSGTFTA